MFGRDAAAGVADGNFHEFSVQARPDANFAAARADRLRRVDRVNSSRLDLTVRKKNQSAAARRNHERAGYYRC
jgi:hypothetical protein